MSIKIMNAAGKIFCLKKTKKTTTPKIGSVVAQSKRNLFGDQQNTNSRQHSFDHCRRKIVSDDAKFEDAQDKLENSRNNYGEKENFIISVRKYSCGHESRKTGSRS